MNAPRNLLTFSRLTLVALFVVSARTAPAAVEQPKTTGIFLKIQGISGTSADEQHKGEIEVLSFNWSAKHKGEGSAATVEPNDALILKPIDASTPKLMLACTSGTAIPEVVVTARGAIGGKGPYDYVRYTFSDVRVTVVSHAVITGAQEQVQFSYGKVTVRYQQPDGSGVEETWEPKAKAEKAGGK